MVEPLAEFKHESAPNLKLEHAPESKSEPEAELNHEPVPDLKPKEATYLKLNIAEPAVSVINVEINFIVDNKYSSLDYLII